MTALSDRVSRLEALHAGLRLARPRPDTPNSWFVASAMTTLSGDVDTCVKAVRDQHEALKSRIGRHSAPTGSMRWLYAAILSRDEASLDLFAELREALRSGKSASGTGGLCAGGSRAALLLSLGDVLDAQTVSEQFFAMKRAINPPFWRRNLSNTDTAAAIHVLSSDHPLDVVGRRQQAVEVFAQDPVARRYKRDGARICSLSNVQPHLALSRFQVFEDYRKSDRGLKRSMTRSMALEWACEGLDLGAIQAISNLKQALPKMSGLGGKERLQIAYVMHQSENASASLNALSGIIAAQTAVIAATITASTSAATVAMGS